MTEGNTSLDELLNGTASEPEAVAQPEATAEAETPETIGQPRDESGRFAPKEATGVETPAPQPEVGVPPTSTEHPVPEDVYKPLKEERRKRQEAEARIAALEAQFQAAQRAQEPEIDYWDNPRGAIRTEVQQAVIEALQAQKQEQAAERIDASEATARAKYADYDDAFHAFRQAVQANPALAQQMSQSSDPAEFAYSKGKTALELGRVGSIDELLKTERAKWEAEARAAMPTPTLPSTTAGDISVGGRSGPAWAGPGTLTDYLR